MRRTLRRGPGSGPRQIAGWLVLPLIPAVLGRASHDTLNFGLAGGPDPRDWGWPSWLLLAGPLLGYGYLAGATLGLPDDPDAAGLRRWLGRRAAWVAVGPWIGFLSVVALYYGGTSLESVLSWAFPEARWIFPAIASAPTEDTFAGRLIARMLPIAGVVWLGYGWLPVAWAARRRAVRSGQAGRSLRRGVVAAVAFVGSLFGSFWAITSVWRDYFFDRRIVPLLVAGCGVALLAGCGGPVTYGEARRRELFRALLVAWLIGLALAWRW